MSGEWVRCCSCGRYIAASDLATSRFDFVPLNEFGPEETSWTCPRCLDAEPEQRVKS